MSNEKYDSTRETEIHREQVKEFMLALADDITKRADEHDKSKLEEPEKSVFDAVTHRLKDLKYGSIEYKESLAEMGPGLDHHYEHNRHHPEHFKGIANEKTGLCYRAGVRGMTLVDVIEMFCDWAAATSRHDNGNIVSSIMANMHRFRLGEVLSTVLMNTAREYSMGRNSSMARSGWLGAHPEYRNWVEEVSEKTREEAGLLAEQKLEFQKEQQRIVEEETILEKQYAPIPADNRCTDERSEELTDTEQPQSQEEE